MIHIFRKYQQTLLIAVTILVILAFVWLFNGSQSGRVTFSGGNKVASVYGQSISQTDIQRVVRKFQVAAALRLDDLLQGLTANAQNQQQALENFVWNSYIFDHQADALQIEPTDFEVQQEYTRVPYFQTDGRFDPSKLTEFVQEVLPSLGFSDSVIDDLLRQQVRVRKVRDLIGSTVVVTPSELKNRFSEANEKMDVSVVRVSTAAVEKNIKVTDAEAKAAYDQHKEFFKSDEQRKVTIAAFTLPSPEAGLTGKPRAEALQKLGDQAWNLDQAVVDKKANFAAEAKKAGAVLSTSGFITNSGTDAALAAVPNAAANVFKLSTQYPASDVIESPEGYYILHLDQTIPSRQLTFEEAKPKVIAQIQKDRAAQLMQTVATEYRNSILKALKSGLPFSVAAATAGLQAESIPTFSLISASRMDDPDASAIVQTALGLPAGQLSDFAQTETGGVFVYMKSRTPATNANADVDEITMRDQLGRQDRMEAFFEWLRLSRESSRLTFAQR